MSRVVEQERSLAEVCCGRPVRTIEIDRAHLVLSFCSECERARWFENGRLIRHDAAVEAVGALARTGRGGRTSYDLARERPRLVPAQPAGRSRPGR